MIPLSNPDKPPLSAAKRRFEVDMSPTAIDRRLREVFALWDFWRYLRNFRENEKPAATRPRASDD